MSSVMEDRDQGKREAARLVVHGLGGAFRAVRLYSPGHGFTQRAIVNALAAVGAYQRAAGPLKMVVLPEGIAFDFDPAPYDDEMAVEFVRALRGGLVRALYLLPGVDETEVRTLFDVLRMPQPTVQGAGGAGVLLRQRGVQCIVIDEFGRETAEEEPARAEEPPVPAPTRIRRPLELPPVRLSDDERNRAYADLIHSFGPALSTHALRRLVDVLPDLDTARFADVSAMLEQQEPDLATLIFVVTALTRLSSELTDARAELARASLHRVMDAAINGPVLRALEQQPLPADHPALLVMRAAPDEAVRLLLELVADEDRRQIRHEIVDLLPALAAGRLDLLVDHLVDSRWYIVRNVVTVLAGIGTAEVVPYLRAGIDHPDARVRRETLQTLGQIPVPQADVELIEALGHQDAETRALAARWLGLRRATEAVPALAAILEREPLGESVRLKHEVVRALGRIGTPAAQSALQRVAVSGGLLRGDDVEGLRQAASAILSELRKQGS